MKSALAMPAMDAQCPSETLRRAYRPTAVMRRASSCASATVIDGVEADVHDGPARLGGVECGQHLAGAEGVVAAGVLAVVDRDGLDGAELGQQLVSHELEVGLARGDDGLPQEASLLAGQFRQDLEARRQRLFADDVFTCEQGGLAHCVVQEVGTATQTVST